MTDPAPDDKKLKDRVVRKVRRMERADRERPNILAQTVYIGTLGLVFVLPVVGGAYLGHWLDGMAPGYSLQWTLSLLFLGIVVGALNVYWLIRSGE